MRNYKSWLIGLDIGFTFISLGLNKLFDALNSMPFVSQFIIGNHMISTCVNISTFISVGVFMLGVFCTILYGVISIFDNVYDWHNIFYGVVCMIIGIVCLLSLSHI